MEGVFKKGLTKAIGVSNFSINQIERVQKSASTKIHNVQVKIYMKFCETATGESDTVENFVFWRNKLF